MNKLIKLISKVFLYACVILVFFNANGQVYKNPIIPGFYPDPSICRVGSDYYLVNSSFEFFPSVPIWHSNDLIHWVQIGNVLNRRSQLDISKVNKSDGIGAATIRYNNGIFYVAVVLSYNGFKNFYVTAKNPAGPWSAPIVVDQSGIDPSMFFDDDGKVYFQTNRAHQFSDERAIYQSEIDIKTGKRLTEIKQIWKGSGGTYVEGPHVYKIKGYYYCITAEGGTSYGHSVAIGRSTNVWGPFESCPANPILTNRSSYSVLQGVGHADLFEAHDGTWWMVHLAFRPAVDGIHFIGRETCLSPVEWTKDGWPLVNKTGMADEFVNVHTLKAIDSIKSTQAYATTQFDKPLGFEWVFMRNPDSANYSLAERKGFLRLRGTNISLDSAASPTFLGVRQRHFDFNVATTVDYTPNADNEEAGITVYMSPKFHYDLYLSKVGSRKFINLRYTLDILKQVAYRFPVANGPIKLKITGSKLKYDFSYFDSQNINHKVGSLPTRFLGTEVAGGFTGVLIGLYAVGIHMNNAPADFDDFQYNF